MTDVSRETCHGDRRAGALSQRRSWLSVRGHCLLTAHLAEGLKQQDHGLMECPQAVDTVFDRSAPIDRLVALNLGGANGKRFSLKCQIVLFTLTCQNQTGFARQLARPNRLHRLGQTGRAFGRDGTPARFAQRALQRERAGEHTGHFRSVRQ